MRSSMRRHRPERKSAGGGARDARTDRRMLELRNDTEQCEASAGAAIYEVFDVPRDLYGNLTKGMVWIYGFMNMYIVSV